MRCQSESNLLPGPCPSEGRWIGPDGLVRCSMHQVQEFGYAEPLVRVAGYEPPRKPGVERKPRRKRTKKTEEVTDTKRERSGKES